MWDTRQTRFAAHFSYNNKTFPTTKKTCCNLSSALKYASFFGFDVAPVAKCKTQSDILIDEYINTRFNQNEKNKENNNNKLNKKKQFKKTEKS